MAVLKKIQFGSGSDSATPLAKTVVTAKSGGVMSVAAPGTVTNGVDEEADYQYELDVNVDGTTIVKSSNSLAIGTVPAANVSVAAGGHNASAEPADNKTFVATTVEGVLLELNTKIDNVDGAAKSYTIVDTTSTAQDLPTNVLKRYRLQQTVGLTDTLVGANIDIPKDSSLKEVYLGASTDTIDSSTGVITKNTVTDPQSMNFAYQLADGTYSLTKIDVSKFLTESEFGDGLSVSNTGVVSANVGDGLEIDSTSKAIEVKIDSTSETDSASSPAAFLSVGANGVKISGIKDEIDRKIAALDYSDTAVSGQYVTEVDETDGVISVSRANVSEAVLNNYAKGSAPAAGSEAVAATDTVNQAIAKLEHQVDAAKSATTSAIQNLDNTDTAVEGQVVTAVSTADGIASPTKANFAGIKLGGFTQDATATGAIASTDTLGGALNKLENAIDAAARAASAAHTVVDHASGNTHVKVSASQPDATTGAVTYTVSETDIASAQALSNEVTRAQNAETGIDAAVGLTKAADAETRTFKPTTNYGENSATVMANMQALDTQIKANANAIAGITYQISGTTLIFNGISEAGA